MGPPRVRAAFGERLHQMVLCVVAFFVFSVMSIFSARYRPLAREGLRCVFRTVTFKPCDTGLDDRIKAEVVSGALRFSPSAARVVNRHFTAFSWLFVALTFASLAYSALGAYNFYFYGNCDGPQATNACVLNDITGDYGRFSEPRGLAAPASLDGIASGNASAANVIVEFGCFTCPYTGKAEPAVHELLRRYNGSVYYVFKPFPLPSHNNSYEAARAVLCARDQGKEWDLRDGIFSQQHACSAGGSLAIRELAEYAGLDMESYDSCMASNATGAELEAYISEGEASNIYATPTFFVNGKPLVGPKTLAQFECAIDRDKGIIGELGCMLQGAG